MDEVSLESIGISWKGPPNLWHTIPKSILPKCSMKGVVTDISGNILFSLKPKHALGSGSFGHVDAFHRIGNDVKVVAIKRPKHPSLNLLLEALFQWKLHNDLIEYGIESCIPRVYDIFSYKSSGDIWFTMESFEPNMLSYWCMNHITASNNLFPLVLLQIALILEVFEQALKIDHRDLKINNMLVVEEAVTFKITWEGVRKELTFPFRIVIIDFGFACLGKILNIHDGLPNVDVCPKEGRDIFQIIVSFWSIQNLRTVLESVWGNWIRQRIESASSEKTRGSYTRLTESAKNIDWMYTATEDPAFRAPLCVPWIIIRDCMKALEGFL